MIITQTPLRISFVGGGTDIPHFYENEGGAVISSAIDKYIFVILKQRFDDMIYVNYTRKEIVSRPEEVVHDLIREALLRTGVQGGIEITTLADVPSEGSGLGSSSSLTVGLLNAFYNWQSKQVTAEQLAREACEIEIELLRKPIGKQDQYIAAYGGMKEFRFARDGSVSVEDLGIRNEKRRVLGSNLLLFYTGHTRDANEILKEQDENTDSNMELLLEMRGQVDQMKRCLEDDDLDGVGALLRDGWERKKRLASSIAGPEIDQMYEIAMREGATGGKVSGVGGGGFLLLYVPREKQNRVRQALKGYRELPFYLERDGSKAIFNMRRYEWR